MKAVGGVIEIAENVASSESIIWSIYMIDGRYSSGCIDDYRHDEIDVTII